MKPFILSLFFLLFAATPVFATDYYVSPAGNDTNPGSSSQPYKTIQKAVDTVRYPGDTVLILPGTYLQPTDYIYGTPMDIRDKHGEPGKDIVFKAYDFNNKPVLKGNTGIRIVASSYITIEGLEVTDNVNASIGMVLSDHITIKNNYTHLDYEATCVGNETDAYAGCRIGWPKGRHNYKGDIIVEDDGNVTPGIYMCKSVNNTIIGNRIENSDEGIYTGTAGNVVASNCQSPQYPATRIWTEGNLIEGNLISDPLSEAVELKPDTRNNTVRGNVVKSTRQFVESSMIEIRGHDNEVTGNIIVGAPNIGIRVLSETISDPDGDRVETYKKADGSYMSAYRNTIHHNYIFSWAQYTASAYGIGTTESSAANIITHNTIVGINEFTGKVGEYASIKSIAYPESTISDNLMVGVRRIDSTVGSEKYEYHLTSYANYLPASSDYNAYYPKTRSNGTSCVASLGSVGNLCTTHNLAYESHSKFLDSNPLVNDPGLCDKTVLLNLPIDQMHDRILYCSTPLAGSAIVNTASDGTNIGAWQTSITPTPTPLNWDLDTDGDVDFLDFSYLISHFSQPYTIFNLNQLIHSL